MLDALEEEITAHFKNLWESLDRRITEILNLSKKTWGSLDGVEERCQDWLMKLDRVRDEQVGMCL